MPIPTEPIGSIPRPRELLEGIEPSLPGRISQEELDARYDDAVRDTIASLEDAGSPVVTDGEQRKPSFVTYPIDGLETLAPTASRSRSPTGTSGSCRASPPARSATAPTPAPTSSWRSPTPTGR